MSTTAPLHRDRPMCTGRRPGLEAPAPPHVRAREGHAAELPAVDGGAEDRVSEAQERHVPRPSPCVCGRGGGGAPPWEFDGLSHVSIGPTHCASVASPQDGPEGTGTRARLWFGAGICWKKTGAVGGNVGPVL